jgi:hypothetical protein
MPDLAQIMAHLADAIAFIRVSQRSLDHLEVAFEEQSLLRMGLAALDAVYTEIDLASIALSKQPPPDARRRKSRTTDAAIRPPSSQPV